MPKNLETLLNYDHIEQRVPLVESQKCKELMTLFSKKRDEATKKEQSIIWSA